VIKDIFNNKDAFIADTTGCTAYSNHKKMLTLDWMGRQIEKKSIKGDIVEMGVYRGTTVLYLAKLFPTRTIWAFDSYCGIQPAEQATHKEHAQSPGGGQYAASLETVKNNFSRYGELTDRIKFVKGYFNKTIEASSIKQIALLRMDSDTYSSTLEILYGLYDKVVNGGYIIADDFKVQGCYKALQRWADETGDFEMYNPRVDRGVFAIENWRERNVKRERRNYSGAWWVKNE
jgi:O-methyltransferase